MGSLLFGSEHFFKETRVACKATEDPGVILLLTAKAAREQNTGQWPQSSHISA